MERLFFCGGSAGITGESAGRRKEHCSGAANAVAHRQGGKGIFSPGQTFFEQPGLYASAEVGDRREATVEHKKEAETMHA